MKTFTKRIVAFMAVVSVVMTMVSCSEEKSEPSMLSAKDVEGTYVGDIKYKVLETNYEEKGLAYKVEASSDDEINLIIPKFGNPPMQIPEVKVKTKVSGSNGEYIIPETVAEGVLGDGKKFAISLRGVITGKEAAVDFSLNYGNMPFPIICSFRGSK